MQPKHFANQLDAEAAIKRTIAEGVCHDGYVQISFSGPGGETSYLAHVRTQGGLTWCLRR